MRCETDSIFPSNCLCLACLNERAVKMRTENLSCRQNINCISKSISITVLQGILYCSYFTAVWTWCRRIQRCPVLGHLAILHPVYLLRDSSPLRRTARESRERESYVNLSSDCTVSSYSCAYSIDSHSMAYMLIGSWPIWKDTERRRQPEGDYESRGTARHHEGHRLDAETWRESLCTVRGRSSQTETHRRAAHGDVLAATWPRRLVSTVEDLHHHQHQHSVSRRMCSCRIYSVNVQQPRSLMNHISRNTSAFFSYSSTIKCYTTYRKFVLSQGNRAMPFISVWCSRHSLYKFKSSQTPKARLHSSRHIGKKQNLT